MDHGTTWDLLLPHPEFAYNSFVNRSTGRSPFEIVIGINLHVPVGLVSFPLPSRPSEGAEDFMQHISEVRVEVRQRIE